MPASHKMLKSREHAKNRAEGIGDADGRIPCRVKAPNVMASCALCMTEIRMTKTNTEAKDHAASKHPTNTFATCFPGQFDPTAPIVAAVVTDGSAAAAAPRPTQGKKAAAKEDMSFLAEAANFNANKVAKGGKKK